MPSQIFQIDHMTNKVGRLTHERQECEFHRTLTWEFGLSIFGFSGGTCTTAFPLTMHELLSRRRFRGDLCVFTAFPSSSFVSGGFHRGVYPESPSVKKQTADQVLAVFVLVIPSLLLLRVTICSVASVAETQWWIKGRDLPPRTSSAQLRTLPYIPRVPQDHKHQREVAQTQYHNPF